MKPIFTVLPIMITFIVVLMAGCNSDPATSNSSNSSKSASQSPKSFKRGIAYDLKSIPDLTAIAPNVSWWYGWGFPQNGGIPESTNSAYAIDFIPMLWNQSFNSNTIVNYLISHPNIKYLLVMNEPNLTDQANRTPAQAAGDWIKYEQVINALSNSGRTVYLVGPAMNWGTMANYGDPVLWLDAFYSNYQANNGGKNPHIDYLAFHWYDWGLDGMLHNLEKYGKKIWVTEMANWNSVTTSLQNEKDRMQEMVTICETNTNVFRYAWFSGRVSPDPHYCSLFSSTNGVLSDLGKYYLSLPYTVTNNASSASSVASVASVASSATSSTGSTGSASSASSGGTPALISGGKTAVGSITNGMFFYSVISRVNDGVTTGDISKCWGLNDGEVSSTPLWLYVDLGQNYTVTEAKVYYQTTGVLAANYKIQYLTNGSNPTNDTWVDAVNKTGNGLATTDDAIANVTARYVRLYIADPSTSTPNVGWGLKWFEYEVYGY